MILYQVFGVEAINNVDDMGAFGWWLNSAAEQTV